MAFNDLIENFKLVYLLDLALVGLVVYKLISLIRGTRAVELIKGILVLVLAGALTNWLELRFISWLLEQIRAILIVALPVVFQPELRRALEQLGRGKFFTKPVMLLKEEDLNRLIGELVKGAQVISKNKMGALIVIEKGSGLTEYIEKGIQLDARFSSELLINLFIPKSPLHDGAIIIRGDRIMSASSLLPLTDNPDLSQELGTRHRAGLGITEISDAVAIVVSEETGFISTALDGKLTRYLDETALKEILEKELGQKEYKPFWAWK